MTTKSHGKCVRKGKENGTYHIITGQGIYWGYIGIMEKKMETTIVYWVVRGIVADLPLMLTKCHA